MQSGVCAEVAGMSEISLEIIFGEIARFWGVHTTEVVAVLSSVVLGGNDLRYRS